MAPFARILPGGEVGSSKDWRETLRRRVLVVAIFTAIWVCGIQARLFYLQVVGRDFLVERARAQQEREIKVSPKRGDIVDRNGRLLAYSVDGELMYADPSMVTDPDGTAKALCKALDDCSRRDRETFVEQLKKTNRYQLLRRRVSPAEVVRVKALPDLTGIGFVTESRRYYPNRDLAAAVLGFVNTDNEGLSGIELTYDGTIRGQPGRIRTVRDRKARTLASEVRQPATAGATLELTLDAYLQFVTERELKRALDDYGAEAGVAVVMEPQTGEILAMASLPTFNPNAYGKSPEDHRRNRAVQDVYEVGSMMKVATAAAALQERVFEFDDMFDVSRGSIQIGSRAPIHDAHVYNALSFLDVVVKSSNVGIIKVGLRLGPERIDRYFRLFGFGTALARHDFPAERSGNVWPLEKLNESAIASMSMGYQIAVTPLQMAAAVSSIANGGELLEPRVVRAVLNGRQRATRERAVIRRTVTPEVAQQLTEMMEQVTTRGTAKGAQVEGFSVAAKTGTAQKIVNGRYSHSLHTGSIVGFVPSKSPVATILVTIDAPHKGGYYGGTVAAPAFKRIAEATLRHLGVRSESDPTTPVLVVKKQEPEVPTGPELRMASMLEPRAELAPTQGLMPDLTGLSAREAVRALAGLGMTARLSGEGLVIAQDVPAGAPVGRGAACSLTLTRHGTGSRDSGSEP